MGTPLYPKSANSCFALRQRRLPFGSFFLVEWKQMLRDAGYYAIGIGKMHYAPQRNGHGFDKLLLEESGRAEAIFRGHFPICQNALSCLS